MRLNLAKELAALERMTVGELQQRYIDVFGEAWLGETFGALREQEKAAQARYDGLQQEAKTLADMVANAEVDLALSAKAYIDRQAQETRTYARQQAQRATIEANQAARDPMNAARDRADAERIKSAQGAERTRLDARRAKLDRMQTNLKRSREVQFYDREERRDQRKKYRIYLDDTQKIQRIRTNVKRIVESLDRIDQGYDRMDTLLKAANARSRPRRERFSDWPNDFISRWTNHARNIAHAQQSEVGRENTSRSSACTLCGVTHLARQR